MSTVKGASVAAARPRRRVRRFSMGRNCAGECLGIHDPKIAAGSHRQLLQALPAQGLYAGFGSGAEGAGGSVGSARVLASVAATTRARSASA